MESEVVDQSFSFAMADASTTTRIPEDAVFEQYISIASAIAVYQVKQRHIIQIQIQIDLFIWQRCRHCTFEVADQTGASASEVFVGFLRGLRK